MPWQSHNMTTRLSANWKCLLTSLPPLTGMGTSIELAFLWAFSLAWLSLIIRAAANAILLNVVMYETSIELLYIHITSMLYYFCTMFYFVQITSQFRLGDIFTLQGLKLKRYVLKVAQQLHTFTQQYNSDAS